MYTKATSPARSIVLWKCVLASLLISAAQAGKFLAPWTAGIDRDYPNNKQLMVGDPMTIEWSLDSGEPLYELKLVQETWPGGSLDAVSGSIDRGIQGTRFTWIVSAVEFNLSFINIFYILVTNGNDSATTHYFNVTTNSPPAAAEPDASVQPFSTGAVTGIAVGTVAALISVLAGLGWWVARAGRKRKRGEGDVAVPGTPGAAVGHKSTHDAHIGGTQISEVEVQSHEQHPVYQVSGR